MFFIKETMDIKGCQWALVWVLSSLDTSCRWRATTATTSRLAPQDHSWDEYVASGGFFLKLCGQISATLQPLYINSICCWFSDLALSSTCCKFFRLCALSSVGTGTVLLNYKETQYSSSRGPTLYHQTKYLLACRRRWCIHIIMIIKTELRNRQEASRNERSENAMKIIRQVYRRFMQYHKSILTPTAYKTLHRPRGFRF